MKILLVFLLLIPSFVGAAELRINLFEKSTNKETIYLFDSNSMKLKETSNGGGKELETINRFKIQGHHVQLNNKQLIHATEILFQGNDAGTDFLIIRDEYNSKSNPLRMFASAVGHPVQVSKIIVISVKDGVMIGKKEIIRKASSYHWNAKILKP